MKKVLIITYYWPPSGGGGVQRWLKFVKYLPDFGWEPIVFTPLNPQFENTDETLSKDINERLKVYKLPISEPYKFLNRFVFLKKRRFKQGVVSEKNKNSLIENVVAWIRGNFFIPDPKISWVKPSVNSLRKIIEAEKPNCIVTTGPPHSMHLIGLKLKQENAIPWVADFRDPWSDWDILDLFHLTSRSRIKHRKLEEKVLKTADAAICVSDSWAKQLKEKYKEDITVITNGFDHEDFKEFKYNPGKEFRLLHAGLLNSYRNPLQFWQIIEDLLEENEAFRSKFKLVFAGNVDNEIINQLKKFKLLAERIIDLGYIDHKKLFQEYSDSSALLLLQNKSKNSAGHIPAKFFEYYATQIPIIAIGDSYSDLAKLIAKYNPLPLCDASNIACQKENLLRIFNAFSEKYPIHKPQHSDKFDRKQLTHSLSELLNKLQS